VSTGIGAIPSPVGALATINVGSVPSFAAIAGTSRANQRPVFSSGGGVELLVSSGQWRLPAITA